MGDAMSEILMDQFSSNSTHLPTWVSQMYYDPSQILVRPHARNKTRSFQSEALRLSVPSVTVNPSLGRELLSHGGLYRCLSPLRVKLTALWCFIPAVEEFCFV